LVTAFDDYRPVAALPVKVAAEAAVMVAELGACTAEFVTITELASISEMVAANANADAAKFFRVGHGWCCNGNGRERCKRKTKLSHVPSFPFVAAQKKTVELHACSCGQKWNSQTVQSLSDGRKSLLGTYSKKRGQNLRPLDLAKLADAIKAPLGATD
jgi:hypothetical protein